MQIVKSLLYDVNANALQTAQLIRHGIVIIRQLFDPVKLEIEVGKRTRDLCQQLFNSPKPDTPPDCWNVNFTKRALSPVAIETSPSVLPTVARLIMESPLWAALQSIIPPRQSRKAANTRGTPQVSASGPCQSSVASGYVLPSHSSLFHNLGSSQPAWSGFWKRMSRPSITQFADHRGTAPRIA